MTALARAWKDDGSVEVGLDEAGRGCLWGRLYVGAVILSPEVEAYADGGAVLGLIKDSKKLSRKKRAGLADWIRDNAVESAVAWAEPEEIDEINILQADIAAMRRALNSLEAPFQRILVDGDFSIKYKPSEVEEITIVGGDASYVSIAAASILAKEAHDDWVAEQVGNNPALHDRYGFGANMGYGTAAHMAGLREWGPTEGHRRSFAPVAAAAAAAAATKGAVGNV
jgi:ribonuclease HII